MITSALTHKTTTLIEQGHTFSLVAVENNPVKCCKSLASAVAS